MGLIATGSLLAVLGGLTALAWACGEPDYVQFDQTLPPLHYNGAIGFLLCGAGYIALAAGRVRAARGLAIALGLVGACALAASAPGVGFRLDRWALAAQRTFPPGGITPALGLGFCLTAGALALRAARPGPGGALLVTMVGALLAVAGPVVLIAARPGTGPVLSEQPSALGAVGAVVAGLGLLAGTVRFGVPTFPLSHAVPVAVGLIGIGVTLALWAALNADQGRRVQRQVQFEAAHVQRLVQDRLAQEPNRLANL
jgi:hypothetical protein